MFGPKYVWLLPATVSGSWIFTPNVFDHFFKASDCNISQIVEAADGFIMSDKVPIRQDNNKTLSGLVRVYEESFFIFIHFIYSFSEIITTLFGTRSWLLDQLRVNTNIQIKLFNCLLMKFKMFFHKYFLGQ